MCTTRESGWVELIAKNCSNVYCQLMTHFLTDSCDLKNLVSWEIAENLANL